MGAPSSAGEVDGALKETEAAVKIFEREEQPQRPPQCAVDVHEFVGDGVYQEVTQRERFGLQGTFAAPRAVRTGERRVA